MQKPWAEVFHGVLPVVTGVSFLKFRLPVA